MAREKQNATQTENRWVRVGRVGVLALTMAGPVFNTIAELLRQRSPSREEYAEQVQEGISDAQDEAAVRLNELALTTRERVAEQIRQLQRQARQLQGQAKQLRKGQRKENRQRRKLNKMVKQLREAGVDWSQELLKRGIDLGGGLAAQTGKVSSDLVERGSQARDDLVKRSKKLSNKAAKRSREVAQDVAERSSDFGQNVAERTGKLSRRLAKRSREVTQDVVERGQQLWQPKRRRNSTFLTVFGFSLGLVIAAVVTYLFLRKRMAQQEEDLDQQIELPQAQAQGRRWNEPGEMKMGETSTSRPTGEISHIDSDGTAVATVQVVGVVNPPVPADAAFVGVVSTKYYYPVGTPLDAKDLVYFVSDEEAKAEGFSRAE